MAARKWTDKYAGALLAAPFTAYLLGFTAIPIAVSVFLSFSKVGAMYNWEGFAGLSNYARLFRDPFFAQTFENTLIYAASVMAVDVCLALVLALSVERVRAGRSVFSVLLASPMLLPAVVTAVVWEIIMDPYVGPLDFFLRLFGVGPVGWLSNPGLALISLIIISVWQTAPLAFLLVLAGVRSIPPQLKEAAQVDGLSSWATFREVTLPVIAPSLVVTVLMVLISSFRAFDILFVINEGGFRAYNALLVYYSYVYAFVPGYQGESMAAAVVLALISSVIGVLFIQAVGIRERLGLKGTGEGGGQRGRLRVRNPFRSRFRVHLPSSSSLIPDFNLPPRLSLSLAYAALILASAFAFFPFLWALVTASNSAGVVMTLLPHNNPISGLAKNFSQAVAQGAPYLVTSLVVAPVVSALSVLMEAPAAYAIARYKVGGAKLLGWALYVYALPSIIFLIPIYTFVSRVGLLNSWLALIMIYPIFALPLGVWMLVGFYKDVPKEVDESAQVDGKTKIQAFFDVVLPMVKPALAVAAFFAVLSSYTEFMFAVTIGTTPYTFGFPPTGAETATVFVAEALTTGSGEITNYGLLSAAGLLVSLPVIAIMAFLQKYIVRGLLFGGIKG